MRRHAGSSSPTRSSSSYVQNFKGMNFNMAMGRLSLAEESTEPSSSSSNTRKYFSRTSPLQSRAVKTTTGRPSNGSGENLGV